MSHTYGGANFFPPTITLPDDGDPAMASAWNPAYEGLADRTEWLRNHLSNRVVESQYFPTNAGFVHASSASNAYAPVTSAQIGTAGIITLATSTLENDFVEVVAYFHLIADGTSDALVKVQWSPVSGPFIDFVGGEVTLALDATPVPGYAYTLPLRTPAISAAQAGSFRVQFQIKVGLVGSNAIMASPSAITVRLIRPIG